MSNKAANKSGRVRRDKQMTRSLHGAPDHRDQESDSAGATGSIIRFSSKLLRPRNGGQAVATPPSQFARSASGSWTFLKLPREASARLRSRGMVSVEGVFNDVRFQTTLQPDGEGGHWLRVDSKLSRAAGAKAGDTVTLQITPVSPDKEPEPEVPPDLRSALAAAPAKARDVWSDITPAARRDFIHWITSGKKAETRVKRIETACDMLAKGKRRPCCFDRSGMYDKSLSCPVAEPIE